MCRPSRHSYAFFLSHSNLSLILTQQCQLTTSNVAYGSAYESLVVLKIPRAVQMQLQRNLLFTTANPTEVEADRKRLNRNYLKRIEVVE